MIEELIIRGCASYDATGATLSGLKQVNYLFGSNGVGKTTISRVVADPSAYPNCEIKWRGGVPADTLVFNRDFVNANFGASSSIKGIFTLGEHDTVKAKRLEKAQEEADEVRKEIEKLNGTLGDKATGTGKAGELAELEAAFLDECWSIKTKYDDRFAKAFEPNRNSKERFKQKVLLEFQSNTSPYLELPELERKAVAVFVDSPAILPRPPLHDSSALIGYDNTTALSTSIVGKKDVDVAALIEKLGMSDWVRVGMTHYEHAAPICPFCQQQTPEDLVVKLNDYFDASYTSQIAALKEFSAQYRAVSAAFVAAMDAIAASEYANLPQDAFQAGVGEIKAIIKLNGERIDAKLREPSTNFELVGLSAKIESLEKIVAEADSEIEKHNAMIADLAKQRSGLSGEVWRHILDSDLSAKIKPYMDKKAAVEKAVAAISEKSSLQKSKLIELEREISELQKSSTSIEPTIKSINELLNSFGFSGFKLGAASDGTHYKISRPDGSDALENLSEGERSFLTFLHFYNLLKGAHDATGNVSTALVVVFDDPVSSLDSDVLFIVSTLLREAINQAAAGNGKIKQVFVLTHNVYFHKEAAFDRRRTNGLLGFESFWIVRKLAGTSVVVKKDKNPIETGYQQLWNEVREAKSTSSNIQNVLRRILENYFKILGGVDVSNLPLQFEGNDRLVCRSLVSWIHDGSHSIHEDVCVALGDGQVEAYLQIFKEIFRKTQHEAHYLMMMGEPQTSAEAAA